jgi:hypothetical protein
VPLKFCPGRLLILLQKKVLNQKLMVVFPECFIFLFQAFLVVEVRFDLSK